MHNYFQVHTQDSNTWQSSDEKMLNYFILLEYLPLCLNYSSFSFVLNIKGALDNFSLIPKFFSKKLRFLYH